MLIQTMIKQVLLLSFIFCHFTLSYNGECGGAGPKRPTSFARYVLNLVVYGTWAHVVEYGLVPTAQKWRVILCLAVACYPGLYLPTAAAAAVLCESLVAFAFVFTLNRCDQMRTNFMIRRSLLLEELAVVVKARAERRAEQQLAKKRRREKSRNIFVRCLDGKTVTVQMKKHNTVADLKAAIWKRKKVPVERQALLFINSKFTNVLSDGATLASAGCFEGATAEMTTVRIVLNGGLPGGMGCGPSKQSAEEVEEHSFGPHSGKVVQNPAFGTVFDEDGETGQVDKTGTTTINRILQKETQFMAEVQAAQTAEGGATAEVLKIACDQSLTAIGTIYCTIIDLREQWADNFGIAGELPSEIKPFHEKDGKEGFTLSGNNYVYHNKRASICTKLKDAEVSLISMLDVVLNEWRLMPTLQQQYHQGDDDLTQEQFRGLPITGFDTTLPTSTKLLAIGVRVVRYHANFGDIASRDSASAVDASLLETRTVTVHVKRDEKKHLLLATVGTTGVMSVTEDFDVLVKGDVIKAVNGKSDLNEEGVQAAMQGMPGNAPAPVAAMAAAMPGNAPSPATAIAAAMQGMPGNAPAPAAATAPSPAAAMAAAMQGKQGMSGNAPAPAAAIAAAMPGHASIGAAIAAAMQETQDMPGNAPAPPAAETAAMQGKQGMPGDAPAPAEGAIDFVVQRSLTWFTWNTPPQTLFPFVEIYCAARNKLVNELVPAIVIDISLYNSEAKKQAAAAGAEVLARLATVATSPGPSLTEDQIAAYTTAHHNDDVPGPKTLARLSYDQYVACGASVTLYKKISKTVASVVHELSAPGLVLLGDVKDKERTIYKSGLKYKGDITKCHDKVRCTVQLETLSDMATVAEALVKMPDFLIVKVKNRFDSTYDALQVGGYRDMNFSGLIKLENGDDDYVWCEVQLNLSQMIALKSGKAEGQAAKAGHEVFDLARALNAFAPESFVHEGEWNSDVAKKASAGWLLELNLNGTRFKDDMQRREFVEALSSKQCRLTTLHMKSMELGSDGATVAQMLESNTSLVSIDLMLNKLGDVGGAAIGDALKVNSTLTSIDLALNKLGDVALSAICNALKVNKTLTSICLDNNNLGGEGGVAIAEALKVNTTLTSISLSIEARGPSLAEAMMIAVTLNSYKEEGTASGLTVVGRAAIVEALKGKTTLIDIKMEE